MVDISQPTDILPNAWRHGAKVVCGLGNGRYADVWKLADGNALRLRHMGYNPYRREWDEFCRIQREKAAYEAQIFTLMNSLQVSGLVIPSVIDQGLWENPQAFQDKKYIAWQVLTCVSGKRLGEYLACSSRKSNFRAIASTLAEGLHEFHVACSHLGIVPDAPRHG